MKRLLLINCIFFFCFQLHLSAQETAESIRDHVYKTYHDADHYQDSSFLRLTISDDLGQIITTVRSCIGHFRTGSFHFYAQLQTIFGNGNTYGQLEAEICKPQGENISMQKIQLGPPKDQIEQLPLTVALGGLSDITSKMSSRIPSLLFEDVVGVKPLGGKSRLELRPESLHPDSLYYQIVSLHQVDSGKQSSIPREYEDPASSSLMAETNEEYWIRKTNFLIERIRGSEQMAGQTPNLYDIFISPSLQKPAKRTDCQ